MRTIQVGSRTPWGIADHVEHIGEGIYRADTPSHGGYYVPDAMLHKIPVKHKAYAQKWSGSAHWYEEDCAWACVALAFPHLFPQGALEIATETIARYVDKNS